MGKIICWFLVFLIDIVNIKRLSVVEIVWIFVVILKGDDVVKYRGEDGKRDLE